MPSNIEVGNSMVTSSSDICNNFNDYFSSIAESILKSDKHPILKAYDKYLTNSPGNSFVFESCDPSEVNMLINQLNPTKSSGPNGIHTKISIPIPTGTDPDKHIVHQFSKKDHI